jgi:hypothetical protein
MLIPPHIISARLGYAVDYTLIRPSSSSILIDELHSDASFFSLHIKCRPSAYFLAKTVEELSCVHLL